MSFDSPSFVNLLILYQLLFQSDVTALNNDLASFDLDIDSISFLIKLIDKGTILHDWRCVHMWINLFYGYSSYLCL